jgi:hypothetical protein
MKARKNRATASKKASETKKLLREAEEKFPIGELVYEKYHPKNIGIVASKPSSFRSMRGVRIYVNVLWMTNKTYGDGEMVLYSCNRLMIKKTKKVL